MTSAPLNRAAIESRLRTSRIGQTLLLLDSVPSTQDIARAEGEAGAGEGVTVLAEEQTAGRGRLQRTWISPKSANLHITMLLRPNLKALRRLSMLTALAAAQGIEEGCGLRAGIKWPNDIVAGGRKMGGILIENELDGNDVRYALVGVGININFDAGAYPEIADTATSCATELGHAVEREAVLAAFLNAFEKLYDAAHRGGDVREAWRARLVTLGQQVRVSFPGLPGNAEEGIAEDVDEEGSLVLRRADGTAAVIPTGEVTLRQ